MNIPNETELELERKFLLKGLPDVSFDRTYNIMQFYTPEARYRIQMCTCCGDTLYLKTVKETIALGVNKEKEEVIDAKEFYNAIPKATRALNKTRFVYMEGVGALAKKYEFDYFPHIDLVMLEREGVTMEDKMNFPEWVTNELINEVTGDLQYNNYALAVMIK